MKGGVLSKSVDPPGRDTESGRFPGQSRDVVPLAVVATLLLALCLGLAGCGPAARVGSFAPTGSLTTGRQGHTATLLNDGRVLIAGGGNTDTSVGNKATYTYLASAELYDPASGTFSLTGSMTTPRSGHTATLLDDGRVLIAGGFDGVGNTPLASAELYDPATGTFSPTGSMTTPRSSHTATLLDDGRVLIAGGGGAGAKEWLASAELYDPETGTFSATGSMAMQRMGPTATLLLDGRVLVAGGYGGVHDGTDLNSAELYDPRTGTFGPTGSMTSTGTGLTATALHDGRVLITDAKSRTAELYDPKTRAFTPTANRFGLSERPPQGDTLMMIDTSVVGTATSLADGRVLIAGASCAKDVCWYPEVFDPSSNSFSAAGSDMIPWPPTLAPRGTQFPPNQGASMTLLKDGRVLFAGGGIGEPDTEAELFVP